MSSMQEDEGLQSGFCPVCRGPRCYAPHGQHTFSQPPVVVSGWKIEEPKKEDG